MLEKRKFTLVFFSWMVFITVFSLVSFKDAETPKFDIPHLDKAVHFTFYFVATILATFFVRELGKGNFPFYRTLWFVLFGAIVYGILIEVLQHVLTVDRDGDLFDALANSVGALVGVLIMKSFFSNERRLKWKN